MKFTGTVYVNFRSFPNSLKNKKIPMKTLISIVFATILFSGCNMLKFHTNVSKDNSLKIVRRPDSITYRSGKLDSLSKYIEGSNQYWVRDLRRYDPSNLNLKDNLNELLHCDFDSKTKWPESLPIGFNPDSIMKIGINPGLGIRKLHESGITGKGVGIAIIDDNLLVSHVEYKDRLRMYEEIHGSANKRASMHGPAVASIAVGKTVGVAPQADLYYISTWNATAFSTINYLLFKKKKVGTAGWYVKSIYRILEINKNLPQDKKIRVISISSGIDDKDFFKAVEDADKEGVFVISCSIGKTHNLRFDGLGKECLTDADDIHSYSPGIFWAKSFYANPDRFKTESTLMVPMDSRCTASQSGNNSYVFYRNGGWSWSVPYIAGLYAMACQIHKSVTPKEFWNKALETGDVIEIERNNRKYRLGKIVNPVKLMEVLKKQKET